MSCAKAEGTSVFEGTFAIPASRQRVWRALVSPAELSIWFAEHAEVEARVGGAFRFWGRHTPSYGGPVHTNQTIYEIETGVMLGFTWNWGGTPTRCEVRLSDAPEGSTTVRVSQRFDAPLPGCDATVSTWVARDFWQLSMGNLDHFLKTGRAALLPDHTQGGGGDVELSIEIDAPASAVWDSITQPEQMAKWLAKDEEFPCDPKVDLRVGGEYSYGWQSEGGCIGPSEILELEPGRRLVHTWSHKGDQTNRTEWTIEELAEDRSRLTVRQVGPGSPREFSGYANGWAAFMLAIRDAVLAA